jgi:excisionase family DNA binding protein
LPLDDLISQAEAARLRGVTRQAIARLIKRGRLRAVNVAGRLLLLREDVMRFEPDAAGRPSRVKRTHD